MYLPSQHIYRDITITQADDIWLIHYARIWSDFNHQAWVNPKNAIYFDSLFLLFVVYFTHILV